MKIEAIQDDRGAKTRLGGRAGAIIAQNGPCNVSVPNSFPIDGRSGIAPKIARKDAAGSLEGAGIKQEPPAIGSPVGAKGTILDPCFPAPDPNASAPIHLASDENHTLESYLGIRARAHTPPLVLGVQNRIIPTDEGEDSPLRV